MELVKRLVCTLMVLWPHAVWAQEPVVKWADYTSWATAAVNPSIAAVQAFRADHPKCELLKLGLSEAIGNVTVLTIKHFVKADRPCMGYDSCRPDGMPSGHSMNGWIGAYANWQVGITVGVATPFLRWKAHRHTVWQTVAGSLIGIGANTAGQYLGSLTPACGT